MVFIDKWIKRLKRSNRIALSARKTREGKRKDEVMSLMCNKESCKVKRGMCGHEKMMLGIMALAIVSSLVYWVG